MPTNFLWSTGTGGPPNTGLVTSVVTLMSTDLISLASSLTAVSAVTLGTSIAGVFASSNFGQAVWGDVYVTHGTSTAALASGANVAGWFMTTPDFTTFESTAGSSSAPLSRPPDFIVPMSTVAYAAGSVLRSAGVVRIPAMPFKIFVQNNTGQTIFSSATANPTMKLAPYALQY